MLCYVIFQKGVYYSAIKIFNNLPHYIKNLAKEIIPFRNTLRRFLLIHSLYDSDEYFNYKRQSIETLKSELTLGFKDSITVFILQLRLF